METIGFVLIALGFGLQWWVGRWHRLGDVGRDVLGPPILAGSGSCVISLLAFALVVVGILLAGGGWLWLSLLVLPLAGRAGVESSRIWYGAPMTAEDMRRTAKQWEEDGRTGRRPLLPVEVKEQARWKKLRDLEPDLSEQEFESLKALIDAHYYGYNYKLDPLAIDHLSDGSFDPYSVSPESDERIRTAFLEHKDKFPEFEEDPPPHWSLERTVTARTSPLPSPAQRDRVRDVMARSCGTTSAAGATAPRKVHLPDRGCSR